MWERFLWIVCTFLHLRYKNFNFISDEFDRKAKFDLVNGFLKNSYETKLKEELEKSFPRTNEMRRSHTMSDLSSERGKKSKLDLDFDV